VVAPFFPSGDQPAAIARCVELLRDEKRKVCCLRGATGTGKTFVVAHVVDALTQEKPRPTLVVVPNKTLAAQVARELRGYLPKKRVELFVSHFSLYVPESFSKGRYVEKRSAIDVDLDALRHRATKALLETDETVIVASVSCLYGLGLPKDYVDARLTLDASKQPNGRDALGLILEKRLLYSECREGGDFVKSGQWAWESGSTHGQTGTRKLIVWPPYERAALELELKPDGAMVSFARRKPAETKTRAETAATTTTTQKSTPEPPETATAPRLTIWPRQHHITPPERLEAATAAIAREAAERAAELRASGDHIEADRLEQRVGADVGLLREIGWCPGAEHYSRHLAGREPGAPPVTLLDYLGFDSSASSSKDQKSIQSGSREWLLVADESHVMLPQLRAMHGGDRSRKLGLVRGGYRLPSALDNRPLNFDEFWARVPKALLVSATPGDTEAAWCASGAFDVAENESSRSGTPGKTSAAVAAKQEEEGVGMVDMVVRPSGVLDPLVTILPRKEQLPALAAAVRRRAARGEASLVCALTKTDCEDLAGYLCLIGGVRADWLHSGLTAKERAVKLQKLQQGELDCLVGAQLLREGLDVPQVSLVIVLDAGVPGFARSSRSLMQMMGRAARNKRGTAILFADEPYTNAMNEAVKEVARRREKQRKHNDLFGVTPRTASRGSASASLSLFEVMASEIKETREAIDAVSLGDRGFASRAPRAEDDEEAFGADGSDADADAVFAPSEEEVERAMRAWRLRRAGADADAAAAATAAAEARARKEAVAQEVGPVWNALARDFTERQFTEALFSATPGDAPELEAGRGEGSSAEGRRELFAEEKENVGTLETLLGAEAVLRAFGGDHAHVASLRASVRDLPAKTGVYRWLDAFGEVLYVGKAKNLRSRTGGYLAPSLLRASPRHRSLLSRARGVDAVLTPGGEHDALLLEARMIQRIKPPLNVLLKHAPRPEAARIVATLDDPVAPRFFVVDANSRGAAGKETRDAETSRTSRGPAGGGGGGGVVSRGGGGGGGSRLAFDGIGGRVSPGTVAAARGAFEAAASEAAVYDRGVDGFFSHDGSVSTTPPTPPDARAEPRTRFWLRPSRADARRALSDLERALDLRALAFRARHGDAEAKERLRENAAVAADALDGGAAASAAASRLEAAGDAAAAAAIRAAAAPEASALGALSALLQEAAAAEAGGGRALSVDVVAAAAHGKHCAVQIVKVRDGSIVDVFAATAQLPTARSVSSDNGSEEFFERASRASLARDRRTGNTEHSLSDPSPIFHEAVEWLGSDEDASGSERDAEAPAGRGYSPEKNENARRDEDEDAKKNAEMSEKVETETALGEATQLCLESYYALGGGGGSRETVAFDADDAPERVYVPHELPDAAGLEQILRAVEGVPRRAAATNAVQTAANRVARDDDFFGDDANDEPTRRTKKKSVRDGTFRRNRCCGTAPSFPRACPPPWRLWLARTPPRRRGKPPTPPTPPRAWRRRSACLAAATTRLWWWRASTSRTSPAPTPPRAWWCSWTARPRPSATGGTTSRPAARASPKGTIRRRCAPRWAKRIAAARRAVSGKRAAAAAAAAESGARVPGALPDLALIDGGAAQLVAAARACLDAGVEVTNARFSEEARNVTSSNAEKKASGPFTFSVALASLAKGRVSGEESVFVPRAVVDASGTIVDFTADRLVVGPGAAATRAGKAAAADGPGLRLLRAVRDESHAVALGAHRSRRRASLFREMRSARDDEASVATG
jgi:excinuclease ABC subunit B